jgi:hypothetical protein
MSRFFKYMDRCPDIPDSLPEHIMEGDSEAELEFEALLISDNSMEIINAPIEIITVSSSEDELEDVEECTPGLAASEVSESSGDEGGEDLDGAADDLEEAVEGLDEGELEKGEPRKGDYRVDPDDVSGLEDESGEENEAPPGLEAEESSSNKDGRTLELIQF